jgi:hypothetical protein
LQRQQIFLFSTASRPTLGPIQPPVRCVPGALSPGVKLTTHLHLVLRLRIHGAVPSLPHTYSWCVNNIIECSDSFTGFAAFLSPSKQMPGYCLKRGHDHFLLHPFQFAV